MLAAGNKGGKGGRGRVVDRSISNDEVNMASTKYTVTSSFAGRYLLNLLQELDSYWDQLT